MVDCTDRECEHAGMNIKHENTLLLLFNSKLQKYVRVGLNVLTTLLQTMTESRPDS